MDDQAKKRIEDLLAKNKIMLFMKGSKNAPMCGFSGAVVQCLNQVGAQYETFNVLEDPEMRDAIKQFSNWPTIPQLYIDQKFVGGCDIVRELYSTGELKTMVG